MSYPSRPAAKSVAELIAGAIDPLVRKRGLARAELMAWWPEIVGQAYAGHVVPERIRWPRDGTAATLVVRCDPALALQFSYESDRVRERLNAYFGYPAVGAMRIVQQRVGRQPPPESGSDSGGPEPELSGRAEAQLAVLDEPLQDSLRALGKAVLARS
jgi:hypothetical protein